MEALQLRFRLGRATLKIGDMLAALVHPLVTVFEDLIHQIFKQWRIRRSAPSRYGAFKSYVSELTNLRQPPKSEMSRAP